MLHAATVAKGAASSCIGAAACHPHGLPWSRRQLEAAAAARAGLACCSGQPAAAAPARMPSLACCAGAACALPPPLDAIHRTAQLWAAPHLQAAACFGFHSFLTAVAFHPLLVQMGLAVGATVGLGIAVPLIAAELQFWKVCAQACSILPLTILAPVVCSIVV